MRRTVVVCCAVLLCASAAAEEDDDVYQGGEIEVRDERLRPVEVFQDTAVETEWVTKEVIETIPATDVAEVIRNLAGIRTQQRIQGQDAVVSIEGMPPEYTRLLVDGERWSGEVGAPGDAADIPLLNVKRIEVLRGNQGTRFGSDAGGGVINVITHDPPEEGWAVRAKAAGGTHPRGLGGAALAGRLGPVGLSLAGEYDRTYGYDRRTSDPDVVFTAVGGEDSVTEEYDLYGKWDAALGETLTVRGNGLYRVEDDHLMPEDGGTSSDRVDTNWRSNTGLEWRPLESTRVATDFTYYVVETDSDVGRPFELFEDEFENDLHLDHFFATGPVEHIVLAGAESLVQRLELDEGLLPPGIESPALAARARDEGFFVPSAYLQTESALTDWFSLVLGARARFHSEFEERILPQAAILVKPHHTLKLRAAWGLNYRTPSLRDLYQPPTPQLGGAYFLAGNEDLEPEESMSLRGGFEWSPRDWLSLSSTAFYNDIEDHIRSSFSETIPIGSETRLVDFRDTVSPERLPELEDLCEAQQLLFPDPGDWTPECRSLLFNERVEQTFVRSSNVFRKMNLDAVETWGVEAQLRFRVTRWAGFAVDYTWLRTRVDDSNIDIDELPNEAEHSFTVRGEVRVPRVESRLSAAFRYRTGVIPEGSGTGLLGFADSSRRTDPSYVLDLRLVQPIAKGFELWADANNVTDEVREDSYAIRGRTFLFGFSFDLASQAP